ncbi:MAG: iron-containing redox enzyme family protein, partial [Aquihabitans sp.]
EIQADEYGGGAVGEAHCEIFAAAMEELGLSSELGHYVERLPGTTLATDNLVAMFGLNRRLRGALVGHLALFEMCSVRPMSRYLQAARRVGGLPALERFYEVHVEADAHHAELALGRMVGGFVETEPDLADDVVFGAAALARVEARFAHHILRAWDDQRTSLRPSLEAALGVAPANDLSARPPAPEEPTARASGPAASGAPGVVSSSS